MPSPGTRSGRMGTVSLCTAGVHGQSMYSGAGCHRRLPRDGDTTGPTGTMPAMPNGAPGERTVSRRRTSSSTANAWAALGEQVDQPLSAAEVTRLRGLGDELDLDEVRQVYLPLSRLLSLRVEAARRLHRQQEEFLHQPQPPRTPFVIGLAGSVAVGKSTTARVLQQMLGHWAEHPHVALVTTDGFLHPNAELERRGPAAAQGLPRVLRPPGPAAVRRRHQVRQGRGRGADLLPPRLRRRARRDGRGAAPRHRDHRGPQRAPAGAGHARTAAPAWR